MKKIIKLSLLLPLVACSNKTTIDTKSTQDKKETEQTSSIQETGQEEAAGGGSGGGGGGGSGGGGGGGAPAPQPQPPQPSLEQRFETWKNQKGDKVVELYKDHDSYKKDLASKYDDDKSTWSSSGDVDAYYNAWRVAGGIEPLKVVYKTTADYTTQKKAYVDSGSSTKRSKDQWLGDNQSNDAYNAWRANQSEGLKTAWKAANNYATKLSDYTTKWKTANVTIDDKSKFVNHQDSQTYYNTYISQLNNNDFINGYKASSQGDHSFTTKFAAFTTSWKTANPTLDTKAKFLADATKSKPYYDEFLKNEDPLKVIYKKTTGANSFASDFAAFQVNWKAANQSLNTKAKFADHNDANTYYNKWIQTSPDALKTVWKASSSGANNFATKLNAFKSGSFTKDTFLNDSVSDQYYDIWSLTRPDALKTAWEASNSGAGNFADKLAAKITSLKSSISQDQFLSSAEGTAYVNKWIATGPKALKDAYEATTDGTNEFVTKANSYFNTAYAKWNTFQKWHASHDFYEWHIVFDKEIINDKDIIKQLWEQGVKSGEDIMTFDNFKRYLSNDTDFNNLLTYVKSQTFRPQNNDLENYFSFTFKTIKSFDPDPRGGRRTETRKVLFELLKKINNGKYDLTGLDNVLNSDASQSLKNQYLAKWDDLFNDLKTSDDLKSDFYKVWVDIAKNNGNRQNDSFYIWALADIKKPANKAKWESFLNGYVNAGGDSTWNQDSWSYYDDVVAETEYYPRSKKALYKNDPGSPYDNDLAVWAAENNNGLNSYKVNGSVTADYDDYISKKAKADYLASNDYNTDLDAWSATKANGLDIYKADAQSDTDYPIGARQKYLSTVAADSDFEAWAGTKANGIATYKNSAQLDDDYNDYLQTKYLASAQFTTDFNTWKSSNTDVKALYGASDQATSDYESYIKSQYEQDPAFNIDLATWLGTSNNGKRIYAASDQLTTDYNAYLENHFVTDTQDAIGFINLVKTWSATKANGVATYKADTQSNTDYAAWDDPQHKTNDKYDNNHLNQLTTDLNAWSQTKANGLSKYLESDQAAIDYGDFLSKKKTKVDEYLTSQEYSNFLDNFINAILTYAVYGQRFASEKWQ